MYTRLHALLMVAILISWFLLLFLIVILRKGVTFNQIKEFNKRSKDEFNVDYGAIIKKDKELDELNKKIKRMQWQIIVARKWRILIPFVLMLILALFIIGPNLYSTYLYSAMLGFLSSSTGLFYGAREYLKTTEKITLINSSYLGHNPYSVKISLESQVDYAISWAFLLVGVLLTSLSFFVGEAIKIISLLS